MIVLFVLGMLATAAAEESGKGPETFTEFGNSHVRSAAIIAVVTVEKVTPVALGTDLVRMSVDELVKGDKSHKSVSVLVSRGGFFENTKLLVFLKPYRSGQRFECFGRVSNTDADFLAKLRTIRQYAKLLNQRNDARRLNEASRLMLDGVASRNGWTRNHFLRQLEYFVPRFGAKLPPKELERLKDLHAQWQPGVPRDRVAKILKALQAKREGAILAPTGR